MSDEAKDYPEQDAEEVVLSRWGKIKQWIEIAMATRKVAMLVWSLVIATGGSVVVGQVTDTRPLRDAAVVVGLLEEAPAGTQLVPYDHSTILDEMMNLQEEVTQLQAEMTEHGHPFEAGVAGIAGIAGPPGPPGPRGVAGVAGVAGKAGEKSADFAMNLEAIRAEIEKILPPNHSGLH